jgi:hypothetical protein
MRLDSRRSGGNCPIGSILLQPQLRFTLPPPRPASDVQIASISVVNPSIALAMGTSTAPQAQFWLPASLAFADTVEPGAADAPSWKTARVSRGSCFGWSLPPYSEATRRGRQELAQHEALRPPCHAHLKRSNFESEIIADPGIVKIPRTNAKSLRFGRLFSTS